MEIPRRNRLLSAHRNCEKIRAEPSITVYMHNGTEVKQPRCRFFAMPLYQIFMMPSTSSTELTFLNCSGNALTTLDVSDCPNLTTLYCSVNALTTLDVSNNTSLTELYCTGIGNAESDVIHTTCDDGIVEASEIAEFLSDVRSQKDPREAGLYDLIKKPDGMLENCYVYGVIYGFFEEEPNLAVRIPSIFRLGLTCRFTLPTVPSSRSNPLAERYCG